jgi:hypothetical protein
MPRVSNKRVMSWGSCTATSSAEFFLLEVGDALVAVLLAPLDVVAVSFAPPTRIRCPSKPRFNSVGFAGGAVVSEPGLVT